MSRGNGTASAISEAPPSPKQVFTFFCPKKERKSAAENSIHGDHQRGDEIFISPFFCLLLSVMKFDAYRITGVSGAATECDSSCSFEGNSSKTFFFLIFSETSKTGNGLEERHCIQLPANYLTFFFLASCLVYYATVTSSSGRSCPSAKVKINVSYGTDLGQLHFTSPQSGILWRILSKNGNLWNSKQTLNFFKCLKQ